MSQISVLIVDDDKEMRINFKKILAQNYFSHIFCAGSVVEMFSILNEEAVDVVLLDNYLSNGMEGHNYIEEIKKINGNIEIIMITSDRSLDLIIKSIKNGAFYYLTKDTFDVFELITLIKKAYDIKKIKEDHQLLSDAYAVLQGDELKFDLITESPSIIEIKRKLDKLAKFKSTNCMLLSGENGVGKTEIAKYYYSKIKNINKFQPFFKIHSNNLNKNNFNEIFFGTTGRKGIIEIANDAIILLEEIDQLQFNIQHLVLSLLKDEFLYVKGNKKKENRMTIICTSGQDLKKFVEKGLFNEDLYYELASISFEVKPLRKRKEDVIQLVKYFTQIFSRTLKIDFPVVPDDILNLFLNYSWPGNISELHSVLEKLFVLGYEDGEYDQNELPEKILALKYGNTPPITNDPLSILKSIVEGTQAYKEKIIMCKRHLIEMSLAKNNYVVTMTAKELKTNRCSLYREINDLKIPFKGIV